MLEPLTLNNSQQAAVDWDEGPLLVLAGPGSGKTQVLTIRIARLIKNTPDKYFKILALTFTNKAASEMRERITDIVPNADERTLLTTFHSFAAELLRQHGHFLGLNPDFTIMALEPDRHSLLEEAIELADSGNSLQSSENLLPLVNGMIENNITPDDAATVLEKASFPHPHDIASVYRNYRSLMLERNTLDFVGLIAEALGLLERFPAVRKHIQTIYPYVCVDEFQDTNVSQYMILQKLVNETTRNLFVVADDDQIIYQWNGANPARLRQLRDEFDMKLVQLPENYRCPPEVVDIANKLIAHNPERFVDGKALAVSKVNYGIPAVRLKSFTQFSEEADWVAQSIASLSSSQRSKCVVLARTRKLLVQVAEALQQKGLAGYLATRKNEFECAPLQWFHSVLRLANSRNSREHLRKVCKAFYALESIELNVNDIISYASAWEGDYARSWAEYVLNSEQISESARNLIGSSLVPRLLERLDFWKFQEDSFDWFDNFSDVNEVDNEYHEEKETWQQLLKEITDGHGKREVTLHLLLQELDLRSMSPKPPNDAVPCFTIHASKGMEFNHVYLVGMVEDQLPSWAAIRKGDNSREMEEERRNCFVAITRARKTLTLTYSKQLYGWSKKPSRFLHEMELL